MNEVSEGKAAARELAARLPGWMVWYGEHTQRFWAVPRTATTPTGAKLAEADSIEELEQAVRHIMGGPAPQPRPSAPEAPQPLMNPHFHSGQPAGDRREPVTANG